MKGIWLCIGCIVLIFSWLPVYSSFFFLVGALWFLHKRFHRGEIICLVFCLLVFVRIQRLSDVHEISSRIVKIQEIKQGYMIGANKEGRFLLYGLKKVSFDDVVELRGTYEKIDSIHNLGQFHFATWAKRKGMVYCMNVKSYTLIKEGTTLRHRLYANIETKDVAIQQFLKAMLYGIHEEEVSFLLLSSGMHIAFLSRFLTKRMARKWGFAKAHRLTLLLMMGMSYLTVLSSSILRVVFFSLISVLFTNFDEKDTLGISMIFTILLAPSMAYEVALLIPVCFRLVFMFHVAKRNKKIVGMLVLFPAQMWFYHTCDPLQMALFSFLRKVYAILYVLAWLLILPATEYLFLLIQWMLAALRLIQQISYPLYGSVSILWLILWCLSAMRYISYVHWKDSLTLCLLLVIFFIRPYLSPFASVTMLDVGQGDCTLIITPYHKEVILIDVMGHKKKNIPKEIIVPYLHAQGIYHLDKIIVTHADMDHSGGVAQLQELMHVDEIIDHKQLAKQQETPWMKFFLLDYEGEDENDNSIVTMLRLYDTSFLFMGDLGIKGEQKLLQLYPKLEADVVKIGHHGSKTSSATAFLHQVHPALALISSGRHNFYGHPHQEVLDAMEKEGILPLISARHGGVTIKICKYFRFFKTAEQQFGIILPR